MLTRKVPVLFSLFYSGTLLYCGWCIFGLEVCISMQTVCSGSAVGVSEMVLCFGRLWVSPSTGSALGTTSTALSCVAARRLAHVLPR